MKSFDKACRRVGEDQGPKLRRTMCETGVSAYERHQRVTLGLRRWKENHPLIARHGRSAAAGIARLVQLCTSMGASHVVNEAGDAMDTACETDRLAESSIREALLDACRHDAKMMRRIQNADRKRGAG